MDFSIVKFVCSYGGKILPRHPDGQLRYIGGETRVVSVDRSIAFADLVVKLGEMYGSSVSIRCQLPKEDLDALISVTSDEDLSNLIEEYDRASQSTQLRIRAFLAPPKTIKKVSPPASMNKTSPPASITGSVGSRASPLQRMAVSRCVRQMSTTKKATGRQMQYYPPRGNPANCYLVHNGNHWQ